MERRRRVDTIQLRDRKEQHMIFHGSLQAQRGAGQSSMQTLSPPPSLLSLIGSCCIARPGQRLRLNGRLDNDLGSWPNIAQRSNSTSPSFPQPYQDSFESFRASIRPIVPSCDS